MDGARHGIIWCPHCGRPHKLVEQFCPITGARLERQVHVAKTSGAHLRSGPRVGSVIAERYRLKRRIGVGGMGEVFEAIDDLEGGRRVAVKVVSGHAGAPDEAIARLEREAAAMSRLRHPNICDVYDVGQLENGAPYLVLEHLTGETLHERLGRTRRLRASLAVDIFCQILSGIEAAHSGGILHRDLKPGNVFLVDAAEGASTAPPAPVVKLLDFGFAKDVSGTRWRTITRPGYACGTPQYMSPEQIGAKPLDRRSDVFSVGIMLFEALTGRHPFDGASVLEVAAKIARDTAPRLRSGRPRASAELDEIVARALARKADDRFQTALDMSRALLRAGGAGADELPPSSRPDSQPSDARSAGLPCLASIAPPSSSH
jgi:serine/threonine-protein kinase